MYAHYVLLKMIHNNLAYRYSYCHVFILALKNTALQLWHFNTFVTQLANYDDLFRPVARRECVILILILWKSNIIGINCRLVYFALRALAIDE